MAFRACQLLLQPTAGQAIALDDLVRGQREVYNAALEARIGAWRWERRSVSRFDQYRHLTGMEHPTVARFGVTVARGTLLRVDRAFQGFFRRVRAGQAPGFPRFKGRYRFDSVEYPDVSCWKIDNGRLYLQGVGSVRFRTSRRGVRGVPKTVTVRREGSRWRVTVFCAEVHAQPLPATGRDVGVDLGIAELVALSDGTMIANPRHGRATVARLAAAQQNLAGRRRGSGRRRRQVETVAALHRKVRNQRRDHAHKVSRTLIDNHDLIVVEDLRIPNMVRRPTPRPNVDGSFDPNGAAAKGGLNRSIHDAGWGQLIAFLTYKAADAGRELIAVNPRHTSQRCARCGHTEAGNRVTQAEFRCCACGHQANADTNAALNILRAGLAQRHHTREAEGLVA